MFIKKLDLKVDFIFFCGYEINVGEHRRGNQETLATLGTKDKAKQKTLKTKKIDQTWTPTKTDG